MFCIAMGHNSFRGGELNMKTRNEQPSFKQKAENKTDSRLDNCSLDNCSKDSRSAKGDMKSNLRLDNCTKKN